MLSDCWNDGASSNGKAIAVFGGADVGHSDARYQAACELGAALALAGHAVVTGGYFGLMEAVSEGARAEGGQVLGITVSSFDPKLPNDHLTSRIHAHDLHDRLRQMTHQSDAIVVLPGGLGTLVETATIWLLKQVEQLASSYPIIVMDSALWNIVERAANDLLISPSDTRHLSFAHDSEEVLRLLDTASNGMASVAPVTIGIAAWNAARHIEAAVNSALSQTVRAVEILVVDDGSDDDTAALVEGLKAPGNGISLIRQGNLGTASALNRVLSACSTAFLIGLDADDVLMPNAVERFWDFARSHPQAAMLYSDHVVIDEFGAELAQRLSAPPEELLDRLTCLHDQLALENTDNFLPAGHGRLYNVERILSMGGYASEFLYAEDFDLVIRIAERWECVHLPEILYQYRWHTTNKGIWGRQGQLDDVRESYRRHLWRTA